MAARVSIVMPVRNGGRFLDAALESVSAQTFDDFELVVVDDGSTDRTPSALAAHAARDERVRVLTQAPQGIVAALDRGLAASASELVARMDADDVSRQERLERQVAFLDARPDHVAVGSAIEIIDEDGLRLARPAPLVEHEQIDRALLGGNGGALPHPTLVVRRAALERVGGYRSEYEWSEDLDVLLRLAEIGRLANLPDLLLDYRIHGASVCTERHETQRRLRLELLREAHERRGLRLDEDALAALTPPVQESLLRQPYGYGLMAIEQGNRRAARRYAGRAIRKRPFSGRAWRLGLRALFAR